MAEVNTTRVKNWGVAGVGFLLLMILMASCESEKDRRATLSRYNINPDSMISGLIQGKEVLYFENPAPCPELDEFNANMMGWAATKQAQGTPVTGKEATAIAAAGAIAYVIAKATGKPIPSQETCDKRYLKERFDAISGKQCKAVVTSVDDEEEEGGFFSVRKGKWHEITTKMSYCDLKFESFHIFQDGKTHLEKLTLLDK